MHFWNSQIFYFTLKLSLNKGENDLSKCRCSINISENFILDKKTFENIFFGAVSLCSLLTFIKFILGGILSHHRSIILPVKLRHFKRTGVVVKRLVWDFLWHWIRYIARKKRCLKNWTNAHKYSYSLDRAHSVQLTEGFGWAWK